MHWQGQEPIDAEMYCSRRKALIQAQMAGISNSTGKDIILPLSLDYDLLDLKLGSHITGPSPWSSGQSSLLQIQRSRVRFPALPDFLRSSGSGTESTQPREYNWGATW
jgi:hypothetical protein